MATKKVISVVARLGLGALFLYAGGIKIQDPSAFARDIHHYQITPWPLSLALGFFLPWLEILAGLGLLLRRLLVGSLAAVAGLCMVFTVGLAAAWARGLDIRCGCFGSSDIAGSANYPLLLSRDLALLATSIFLLVREARASAAPSDATD